jgi:hypothetical protein
MSERIFWNNTPNGIEIGVEVTVVDQSQYEDGVFVFDGKLDSVIASLLRIKATIPEEFRAVAEFEIESRSDYDSHRASVVVKYRRPATAEESAQWHSQRAADAARREAQERATLLALQSKYGSA